MRYNSCRPFSFPDHPRFLPNDYPMGVQNFSAILPRCDPPKDSTPCPPGYPLCRFAWGPAGQRPSLYRSGCSEEAPRPLGRTVGAG